MYCYGAILLPYDCLLTCINAVMQNTILMLEEQCFPTQTLLSLLIISMLFDKLIKQYGLGVILSPILL